MTNIEIIKEKTKELLRYANAYYNLDAPLISDAQYDKKFDELKALENETGFWLTNSPTRKVQGETVSKLAKVKHSIPMLSADKSTDINDVKKFVGDKVVVASFKCDGGTVVVKYKDGKFFQALTRGSGIEGEDITHTARMIKNLPMNIPYTGYLEVRGEALIPWKYYNEMNVDGDMGHPRNVASGGLRQLSSIEAAKRNIYFYAFTLVNWKDCNVYTKFNSLKFLSKNGFDIVPCVMIPDYTVEEAIAFLNREDYENPTDGWCFEYNDLVYGESLGSTSHHDRRLYALKPEVKEHTTIFRGIDYNTCRTGIVSLTAIFDPVEIDNTMVGRATLHNIDFFRELELGSGDEISVTKFNEIIPGIVENNTRSNTYKLIDTCPSCGGKLEIKNTGNANYLYCPNEACPARELSKFEHFVSKPCVNIDGLSEATLEKFIDAGFIKTYADIYHLDRYRDRIIGMEGFGEKSYNKLIESIEKSRNIKIENFITALGIPLIGKTASKTIAKYLKTGSWQEFEELFKNDFDFTTLEDFGVNMHNSLWNWYNFTYCGTDFVYDSFNNLINEFNFVVKEDTHVENDFFNGKTLCITGNFLKYKRSEVEKLITDRGGKLTGSVSKKTDFLLTNDGESGSSKAVKAKELGIPIMSEEEFIKKIQQG